MTVLLTPRPFLDVVVGGVDDIRFWFYLLREVGADISDYAKQSFLSSHFVTASKPETISLGRVTVADYGFPHGAQYHQLVAQGRVLDGILPWEAVLPACHVYDDHGQGEELHFLTEPASLGGGLDIILKIYRPSCTRAVHFRHIGRESFFEPREELIVRIR